MIDARTPGVLLARPDGVIVVPNAIPWPAGLAATVEHLIDALDVPPPDQRPQQHNDREDPK